MEASVVLQLKDRGVLGMDLSNERVKAILAPGVVLRFALK